MGTEIVRVAFLVVTATALVTLAAEYTTVLSDPTVQDALHKLAGHFRSEQDTGPCAVVEIEEKLGDQRATRKLQAFTRVQDFLHAVGIRPP